MGSAYRQFIVAFDEAFECILADGGEHKESRFRIDLFHLLRQAFVHHGSHAVEYVEAQIALGIAHGFNAFQRAASGKHGKPPEESLFSGIEQAVTPVHGTEKSLLPGGQIAGTSGQQVQTAFEACQHGGRRKQLDARRQFDGQRQAERRAQMAATAGAFSRVSANSRFIAGARSTKSATAGRRESTSRGGMDLRLGSARGGTGNSCSP